MTKIMNQDIQIPDLNVSSAAAPHGQLLPDLQRTTAAVPAIGQQQVLMSAPLSQTPPPIPPVITQSTVPGESIDEDALDIEWVNKAKEIVEQTHTDPYAESVALSKARADYLHQRYAKQLKQP